MTEELQNTDEFLAAESIFREYLRERGLKYTAERQRILVGVMQNEQHFEAEQLLFELRSGGHRVAKATIYRTLPLLVNCGLIKQVQFGEKWARYEHTLGHAPHDHMICTKCRKVIEFDGTAIADTAARIASNYGFRAMSHRFQITGLCAECGTAGAGEAPQP